jgi:hypothetical protein
MPAVNEDDGLTWRTRAVIGVVVLAVLVASYFLWREFVPRWWGQRVGHAAKGTFTWGIIWGLFAGVLFTAAPLATGLLAFHKHFAWKTRLWFLLGAIVLAAPNLMTAGIVWGSSNGAHAGDRIMDVDAPGFRGATLIGVIVGVLLAGAVEVGRMVRRKNASELAALRADQKVRDADL